MPDWFTTNAPQASRSPDWFAANAPAARRPVSAEDFIDQQAQTAAQTADLDPSGWAQAFGHGVLGSLADRVSPDVRAAIGHGVIGILKGAGHTAETLGQLVHKIPGVSTLVDTALRTPGISSRSFPAAEQALQAEGTAEKVGRAGEQIAEFLVPAGTGEKIAAQAAPFVSKFVNAPRLVQAVAKQTPRIAAEAAVSGATATAQGENPTAASLAGAVSPIAADMAAGASQYLRGKAADLTRAAVKPTVSALRKIAGAGATGLNAQADKLVRFILDNNLTTGEGARALVADAERGLQSLIQTHNAPTDAPQRAMRYLSSLERSAAKQGLAADDVAAIRNAAAEVLQGTMGKDVVTMVPTPHPTLVGPNGQPITVLTPQTTRALRTDMMADEALESARASSQWSTRKQWGEQKGATMEATKAVERAQRDAVKAVVPGAAEKLAQQQQGMVAADVLDRMQQRTANRDALSLPGVAAAGAELAAGKVPLLGFAAQWLRNNQLRAGQWANKLAKAIDQQDVKTVGAILNRLGVGTVAQAGQQP